MNAVLEVPQDVRQALERRDYASAEPLLAAEVARQPGAEAHALLALACYQNEHYEGALKHYSAALAAAPLDDPRRSDWQAMRALSEANAEARVDQHVPPLVYFDRTSLLAPSPVRDGDLPAPLPPLVRHTWLRHQAHRIGTQLGHVATAAVELTTHLWGWVAGYRNVVWTNWYHRPVALAVLTLAYMREKLNAKNLATSYPPGTLVGFQEPGQTPPVGVTHFRTADGSWNNLADPKEGAAGTRFLRNVAREAVRPESGDTLLSPNPRLVSRALLSRPLDAHGTPAVQEVPFLNLLAGAWIQFMNSDWINHGEIRFKEAIEVPLPEDDPARRRYWQTAMFIGRTQEDPTRMPGEEVVAYSAVNEVTHWWDGSQIYGSDQATQTRLRSGVQGKLKLQADGRLPTNAQGVEDTGFNRNWWVGLSLLHTLFVHEHNAICDALHAGYPEWEDNRLFNVARLINAAVMAKIHTIEWTPAILPNPALWQAMHANWYGLLSNAAHPHGGPRRTTSPIKVANPELGGVVGNPIDKHGRGFALTEEFVEVYRLHSLLPEELVLRRQGEAAANAEPERLPFAKSRQSGSPRLTARYALADLFYSFGNQHPGALVMNNYPRFLQELAIPGNPFFDMGTVDIVRARERGVPRYNEFRRQLGLHPIRRMEELTDDAAQVARLKSVYGSDPSDVEKIDLLVGTLAEGHRPTHFGFGETMFQIFILNATRRLQADRFYTDCFDEDHYTPEGLRWIDSTDLKTVILRHMPELADTGLANIRNAFEPWDETPVLDTTRHPLRLCDPATRDNPTQGEAYRAFPPPPDGAPDGAAAAATITGVAS